MGVCLAGSLASGGMGLRLTRGRWWVRLGSLERQARRRDLNLAVRLDAVPHTVPGTYAEPISWQSWRSSSRRIGVPCRGGVGAAVRLRGLPHAGVICRCCDRGQIYCAGDCARQARRRAVQCAGQRYQNGPYGTPPPRGSPRSLPGAGQKSDASGFTPAAGAPCPTPCRARMQGQYPGNRGVRPPGVLASPCRGSVSAAVPLRGLPAAGADLQLLRPRPDLLCRGLRPASPAPLASVRRTALPEWSDGATPPCRATRSLPGARQKSDASGFTPTATR